MKQVKTTLTKNLDGLWRKRHIFLLRKPLLVSITTKKGRSRGERKDPVRGKDRGGMETSLHQEDGNGTRSGGKRGA